MIELGIVLSLAEHLATCTDDANLLEDENLSGTAELLSMFLKWYKTFQPHILDCSRRDFSVGSSSSGTCQFRPRPFPKDLEESSTSCQENALTTARELQQWLQEMDSLLNFSEKMTKTYISDDGSGLIKSDTAILYLGDCFFTCLGKDDRDARMILTEEELIVTEPLCENLFRRYRKVFAVSPLVYRVLISLD